MSDAHRMLEIRRRRRPGVVLLLSVTLVVVFAVVSVGALWKWREAEARGDRVREAMARADAAHAISLAGGDPARTAALALRALELDDKTPLAAEVLWNALASRAWLRASALPWQVAGPVIASAFPADPTQPGAVITSDGILQILVPGQNSASSLAWDAPVTTVAIASSPAVILFGDAAGQVTAWDAATQKLLWQVPLAPSPIVALTLAPGPQPILLASTRDALIASINPVTGETLHGWTTRQTIERLGVPAAPGRPVILASGVGLLVLPTITQPSPIPLWPPADSPLPGLLGEPVLDFAFDPSGALLVVGADRLLHIFDRDVEHASGYRFRGEIALDVPPVRVGILPDGRFLVGCLDGTLHTVSGANGLQATNFAAAPDRPDALRDLLVLANGHVARLYTSHRIDLASGATARLPVEAIALGEAVLTLAPGPDANSFLALGPASRPVLLPSTPATLPGGAYLSALPGEMPALPLACMASLPRVFQVGPDGLYSTDLSGSEATRTLFHSSPEPIEAFALSPDDRSLLLRKPGKLLLLDAATAQPRWEIALEPADTVGLGSAGESGGISWFCAPSGKTTHWALWETSEGGDKLLVGWVEDSVSARASIAGGAGPVVFLPAEGGNEPSSVAIFSADGNLFLLALPGLEVVRTIPLSAHEPRPNRDPRRMAVSSDGRFLLAGTSGGTVHLVQPAADQFFSIPNNGPIAHLQFDDDSFLVVCEYGIARVFSVATPSLPRMLREFRTVPPTEGLALLYTGAGPDGLLATVDRFSGLRLWDWHGGLVADRGPRGRPTPNDPAQAVSLLAAGGPPSQIWIAAFDRGNGLLALLPTEPQLVGTNARADFLAAAKALIPVYEPPD